ncbi:hypothetical protein CPB84DRAFT_1398250 [Gymnopilus junonius]|uniref:F-box domain-containing protein n=1 Tax=Gymnopilus junonius TaxID=109634 RepID=A0A9P5TK38_GYMJU|nr:hypothetical protein CPB84DRAFT_1398250 [Gymnopilus junonius]
MDRPPPSSAPELVHRSHCQPHSRSESFESQALQKGGTMDQLMEIEHQRERRSTMNRSHDPFIHRLPPELGSYIFRLCGLYRPWVLCGICSYWRQIACSTPELWSELYIPVRNTHSSESCNVIEMALHRSGSLPLSLSISSPQHRSDKLSATMSTLIAMVNQCSGRWYSLSFEVPSWVLPLISPSNGNPTLLKKLQLRAFWDSAPIHDQDSLQMSSASPTSLILWIPGCRLDFVSIKWSCMTTVDVDSFREDECLELLRRCPQLVTLKVKISLDTGGTPFSMTAVNHPQLQIFKLTVNEEAPEDLLELLTLPNLQTFSYYDGHLYPFPPRILTSLFRRSDCAVMDLCLDAEIIGTDDFIELLESIPSLRNLKFKSTIDSDCHADVILECLSEFSKTDVNFMPNVLPQLLSLECVCPYPLQWEHVTASFGPIGERHGSPCRPLKKIKVRINFDPDEDGVLGMDYMLIPTIRRIYNILGAGVDLDIQCYDPDGGSTFNIGVVEFERTSLNYHSSRVDKLVHEISDSISELMRDDVGIKFL